MHSSINNGTLAVNKFSLSNNKFTADVFNYVLTLKQN